MCMPLTIEVEEMQEVFTCFSDNFKTFKSVRWLGAYGHASSLEDALEYEWAGASDVCSALIPCSGVMPRVAGAGIGLLSVGCYNPRFHEFDAYTVKNSNGELEKTREDIKSTTDISTAYEWLDSENRESYEYVEVNGSYHRYEALVIREDLLEVVFGEVETEGYYYKYSREYSREEIDSGQMFKDMSDKRISRINVIRYERIYDTVTNIRYKLPIEANFSYIVREKKSKQSGILQYQQEFKNWQINMVCQ